MCEPHRDPVNGRDRCVARMLARHAGSLDIARTLATTGERFIAGLEVDADDPLHVVPACLLIRQISGLRSLCLLAVNGFYTEALGHQRSLMEALARITAIEKKPELIHDYLVQDVLNRKKLLGDVLSFRSDWGPETPLDLPDDEVEEAIRAAQADLDAFRNTHGRNAREVKTFDWAQTGGVAHLLLGRFVMASEALHFSPKSLARLMVAEGEHLQRIRIGPEDADLDDLILDACKYVFVGIQSLANILSVDVADDIAELYRRFDQCHTARAEAALGAAPRE